MRATSSVAVPVKFYKASESLCRIVAEFLGDGLRAQQPALAIVTPEHRAGILAELGARHIDVEAVEDAGDLLLLDVADTLTTFMVNGELVDVLWTAGQDASRSRRTRR